MHSLLLSLWSILSCIPKWGQYLLGAVGRQSHPSTLPSGMTSHGNLDCWKCFVTWSWKVSLWRVHMYCKELPKRYIICCPLMECRSCRGHSNCVSLSPQAITGLRTVSSFSVNSIWNQQTLYVVYVFHQRHFCEIERGFGCCLQINKSSRKCLFHHITL